jgi:hypothetical protein
MERLWEIDHIDLLRQDLDDGQGNYLNEGMESLITNEKTPKSHPESTEDGRQYDNPSSCNGWIKEVIIDNSLL